MVDFSKAIIFDEPLEGLLSQASRERLLAGKLDPNLKGSKRQTAANIQDSLSLLILFDQLLIPDFTSSLRIPGLEDTDLIRVLPIGNLPWQEPVALDETFLVSRCQAFVKALERASEIRPLVLNRVLMGLDDGDMWSIIARATKISKYEVIEQALDYFLAFYKGDEERLRNNLLFQILPQDVLQMINDDLLESRDDDKVSPGKVLLASFIIAADQIKILHELSQEQQAGIATRKYTGLMPEVKSSDLHADSLNLTRGFCLLRCALHEEGRFFPKIESIEHALRLRKDPNLQSFREQLGLFHSYLSLGDNDAIVKLVEEVKKAQRALQRTKSWDTTLKWVTYLSLPVGFVEPFLIGLPVIGTTMGIFSVVATFGVDQVKKKNEWVLFGR
jgi:hypothetical protein